MTAGHGAMRLCAWAFAIVVAGSCRCESDAASTPFANEETANEEPTPQHEQAPRTTTRGADVNTVSDLQLLGGRLRARIAGRRERTPGGLPSHGEGEHWVEEHRFTAACGLLSLTAEESLTRAPADLAAAVSSEETTEERTTVIDVMDDARAPLRVVRVLKHDDVETDGRFFAARLYVAFSDRSVVELGLACEENAMNAAEWDALTKPFVASLVAGSRAPTFAAATRTVALRSTRIALAVPEGWAIAGRRDEQEIGFVVTQVVDLGRPPAALAVFSNAECEDDPDGRALAETNGVEGALHRVDGRIASQPVSWFADRNERTLFVRHRSNGSTCLDWSIESPDAAGVAAARRIAESATIQPGSAR